MCTSGEAEFQGRHRFKNDLLFSRYVSRIVTDPLLYCGSLKTIYTEPSNAVRVLEIILPVLGRAR